MHELFCRARVWNGRSRANDRIAALLPSRSVNAIVFEVSFTQEVSPPGAEESGGQRKTTGNGAVRKKLDDGGVGVNGKC